MTVPRSQYRVGVDVGGTFTDIVVMGDQCQLMVKKVLSTPHDYSSAIISGLSDILSEAGIAPQEIREVCHGSTAATNAVLERKGAVVGLITTKGFRDVLELRRLRTPTLYNQFYRPPAPLVPRFLRAEVQERIDARGNVVTPLDEEQVRQIVKSLLEKNVNSIAICLLNSYVNPVHERRIGELVTQEAPDIFVSLSCEVAPGVGEFERTSTVVANGYVKPVMSGYISSLKQQLVEKGAVGPLFIMQSNGGMMTSRMSIERPIVTLESGPAAGVAGGEFLSKQLGLDDVITFDMGGTTTKAALIEGGNAHQSPEYDIGAPVSQRSRLFRAGGYALMVRAVDLAEVGAGGGSIVSTDEGGSLKVGPQSAGADPGPVCYNRGGVEPTITDANLLLGYLNPGQLAGGAVVLDPEKAETAFREKVAKPMGLDLDEAAYGVHLIANATMANALRSVSTERGRDIRNFVLCTFGGSGPVHAAQLARSMGIRKVVVPFAPGLFSGFGLLVAPHRYEFVAGFMGQPRDTGVEALVKAFRRLEQSATDTLKEEGYIPEELTFSWQADMHYVGQSHELTNALPKELSLEDLEETFGKEHERTYAYRSDREPVEVTNVRVVAQERNAEARGSTAFPFGQTLYGDGANSATPTKSRMAYFGRETGAIEAPIIHRRQLDAAGQEGPVILDEYDSTIVVPPNCWVGRDDMWNVVLEWR